MLLPIVLAIIALGLWLLPVTFEVQYTWRGYHYIRFDVSLLGLFKYSRDFTPTRRKERKEESHVFPSLGYLKRRILWKSMVLSVRVGLGNAASTAIASGSLWGILSSFAMLASRYLGIPLKAIRLQVSPDFTNQVLEASVTAKFRIRLGHLVVTGLNVVWGISRAKLRGRSVQARATEFTR